MPVGLSRCRLTPWVFFCSDHLPQWLFLAARPSSDRSDKRAAPSDLHAATVIQNWWAKHTPWVVCCGGDMPVRFAVPWVLGWCCFTPMVISALVTCRCGYSWRHAHRPTGPTGPTGPTNVPPPRIRRPLRLFKTGGQSIPRGWFRFGDLPIRFAVPWDVTTR